MRVIDSLATPGTEPGERANYKGAVVIWSGAIWRDSGERVTFSRLLEAAGFQQTVEAVVHQPEGASDVEVTMDFGAGEYPVMTVRSKRARRSDPETSHLAGALIESQMTAIQAKVLDFARRCGPHGFTDEQLSAHFASDAHSTHRTRRSELTRAGYIVDSGERAIISTGRYATIWVAKEHRK